MRSMKETPWGGAWVVIGTVALSLMSGWGVAQVRKVARGHGGEMPAVPITVRQLEAIVRISESLARMQLQPVATEAHVREAIDLFKTSTMEAVKSGAPCALVQAPCPAQT